MTKKKYYPDTDSNPNLPKIEENILDFWKKDGTFRKSLEPHRQPPPVNGGGQGGGNANHSLEWVFYDGPPFANGLPHYGHLLTSFVKDLFARYHTMKGQKVDRRFGWDCHGLPAEMEAEKELGVSGRNAIEDFGIDKFNEHCRTSVMKYTHIWQDYVTRAARWVDFDNDYKTMDITYMESVLWAFKQLYDKGLVYESYRVMPYSWAAQTPLSNFETRMDDAYRDREDKAITVAFEFKEKPEGAPDADKYYLLAWTTTPWTLPSNLALAVSPKMQYACVLSSPLAGEHDAPKHVGGGKTDFATEKAQEMRKEPTEAERKLWYHLSREQLGGYKFRRQQPIGNYIADFYNAEKRLVIEIDGGQHADNLKDAMRTKWLESQGLKILRFWNNEVLQNIEGVLEQILHSLENTPHAVSKETAAPPQGGSKKICYILAESVITKYHNELAQKKYETGGTGLDYILVKGEKLLNLPYHPLFPYFADTPNAFRILDGSDFIEEGSGTGVVHLAPGFGEDDQRVCEKAGIPIICPVDEAGRYTDEIFDIMEENADIPPPVYGEVLSLKGLNVIAEIRKDPDEPYNENQLKKYGLANLRIIDYLKRTGVLIKQEEYKHSYPHCWRTDTPLIYKAVPSWYVEVTKFKDRMVELNKTINWIPEHIRDGQFGKWLENARDWSISRNRFWGTPIPVWKSNKGNIKVFGSIKELEEFFFESSDTPRQPPLVNGGKQGGGKITDLHRPFIDTLTKTDPETGESWKRVTDVFDCWFESGSMPFAQVHYPFAPPTPPPQAGGNRGGDWFDKHFPADFIVEYVGQTRGWFYTLVVLATALFDKIPFKNCICHGIILDTNGKKLSKKLRNYPDPYEMFNLYGADAMRFRMIKEPVMHGGNLLISKDGSDIKDVVRLSIKPLWNAYHFFTLYANTDNISAECLVLSDKKEESTQHTSLSTHHLNLMDRYILAKLKQTVKTIESALDTFDTPSACKAFDDFFEVLNNWYIRRNRDRFWREASVIASEQSERDNPSDISENGLLRRHTPPRNDSILQDADKQAAYDTLYTVLVTMCRAAAPLLPLVTEEIHKGLTGKESVHLANFPDVSRIPDESELVSDMDRVRDICNAALAIRNRENSRIRQPLSELVITGYSVQNISKYSSLIEDEVNIKRVKVLPPEEMSQYGSFKLQLIFPILGKRLKDEGKADKMKKLTEAAKSGDWEKLKDRPERRRVADELIFEGEYRQLLDAKNPKNTEALSTQDALVILDLNISPELKAEGIARDVVRMIQQARKDADLNVSDRININISADKEIQEAINSNLDYIKEQTLALSLDFSDKEKNYKSEDEIEGKKIVISFDVIT